ncbi:MAG: NAD+ kinase [Chloroflexi bacterium]|nr:NAD+ kinase [Chloroflexota bacterium]
MDFEKIVLVTRKTRLQGLVERFNTIGQARFYLEHGGGNFSLYQQEHDVYYTAIDRLRSELNILDKFQEIERGFLPNFLFNETDIIVTVGVDGLVANTAKYLNGQPLIAVNPDPEHIDGILLPFRVDQAAASVRDVVKNQFRARQITMAETRLNDGQSLLAFNDLFIGVKSHISARYRIEMGKRQERQSSSGVIISTGVGSTGWLSSMFNMAEGITRGFDPKPTTKKDGTKKFRLDWEAEKLAFIVREPFASKTSGAEIVSGYITPNTPLTIHSEMPENGVIFSDGVETDFLAFNAGAIATIGMAKKKTQLVVGNPKA